MAIRAACAQQLDTAEQRLHGVAAQLAASADANARPWWPPRSARRRLRGGWRSGKWTLTPRPSR